MSENAENHNDDVQDIGEGEDVDMIVDGEGERLDMN